MAWLSGMVLLVGLALTGVLVQRQCAADAALAEVRFAQEIRSSTDALAQRIVAYTEAVAGLRDLFLIDPELDFAQFQQVAMTHNLRQSYPEIRNVTFVRRVLPQELDAYAARMRVQAERLGRTAPALPEPGRDEYFLIEYLWPMDASTYIWGLDLATQPNNLASMLSARDSGMPAVSPPFRLRQEQQPVHAFTLRLPVFRAAGATAQTAQPDTLLGGVSAAVDVRAMLASVEQQGFLRGIAVTLEDVGSARSPEHTKPLLLGASDNFARAEQQGHAAAQVRALQVHDRRWRLRFVPTRPLLSETERLLPWALAGSGVLLSGLLAALLWWAQRRQMQAALARTEAQQRSILDHLPVGVNLVREDGTISYRNRSFVQITGYDEQAVPDAATWWRKACPDPAYRKHMRLQWAAALEQARQGSGLIKPLEYTITHADGKERCLQISGSLLGERQLCVIQDLTPYKAAEEKINYLEFYDALTQLPNRRLLLKSLEQALQASTRHGDYGAVLMLDIDHFKTVNETLGHECGDTLLRQVAERLYSCTQERYVMARHGDDEFVVLLERLASLPGQAVARAEAFGRRVLEAFRAPFVLHQRPYHCTASIGITLFHGLQEDADELLKRADLAMYQAKTAGRDTLHFYSPNLQSTIQARVQLEAAMRQGLAQQHFELYYQPQVHCGQVVGCEALLRWNHPERGMVSPAEFIPLAEACGFIVALGNWVLHTACEQLAAWARVPHLAHLSIAINVSPRQFHQHDFVQQVLDALKRTGADPRKLELELTESLLLQDVEDTIDKMLELKRHGVTFALDDFGTGYSSLSYLKRLPLNQLKIDQSFVRDVLTDANDAAIARTIVALGTSLGLSVIAEGVETVAQRDCLQGYGCLMWQGYLFSRPLPAAQFADWVRQFSAQAKTA